MRNQDYPIRNQDSSIERVEGVLCYKMMNICKIYIEIAPRCTPTMPVVLYNQHFSIGNQHSSIENQDS